MTSACLTMYIAQPRSEGNSEGREFLASLQTKKRSVRSTPKLA